jgi:hypothetical protein
MAGLAESHMTVVSMIILVINLGQVLDRIFCAFSHCSADWQATSRMSDALCHDVCR